MQFVFLVMALTIVAGLLIERILPQPLKDRLGAMICWAMMAVTMTFLGLATLALIWVLWANLIQPALVS
jgi:hypothetical protein